MFERIDDLLHDWAKSHRVLWNRSHCDEEVRSVELPLPDGRLAQIWLEPDPDGEWKIRAWDRKLQRYSLAVTTSQLQQGLSNALGTVKSWALA
jgi:hypothetical protein